VRYNPYYRHLPKGYSGRMETTGKSCFLIYNDDGTIATGPTGERFCFNEAKAQEIVARLNKVKTATPADYTADDISFEVADGKIVIMKGDVYFLGSDGKNHGVILHGASDPDRAYVAALRQAIKSLHAAGRAASMSGLTLLTLDPLGGVQPRGASIQVRTFKNRR
jgi:hypothetical protein